MKRLRKSKKSEQNVQMQKSENESYAKNLMFESGDPQIAESFTSFTNEQKIKQGEELRLLSKLDYNKHEMSVREEGSDLFHYCRQKLCEGSRKAIQMKEEQSSQGYRVVDSKAVLLRGKLVYLRDDADIKQDIATNQGLLKVLKNNHVNLKQYLYGDRAAFLSTIQADRQNSEKQLMNKYIQEHISPEKAGSIETYEWYDKVKDTIFGD